MTFFGVVDGWTALTFVGCLSLLWLGPRLALWQIAGWLVFVGYVWLRKSPTEELLEAKRILKSEGLVSREEKLAKKETEFKGGSRIKQGPADFARHKFFFSLLVRFFSEVVVQRGHVKDVQKPSTQQETSQQEATQKTEIVQQPEPAQKETVKESTELESKSSQSIGVDAKKDLQTLQDDDIAAGIEAARARRRAKLAATSLQADYPEGSCVVTELPSFAALQAQLAQSLSASGSNEAEDNDEAPVEEAEAPDEAPETAAVPLVHLRKLARKRAQRIRAE